MGYLSSRRCPFARRRIWEAGIWPFGFSKLPSYRTFRVIEITWVTDIGTILAGPTATTPHRMVVTRPPSHLLSAHWALVNLFIYSLLPFFFVPSGCTGRAVVTNRGFQALSIVELERNPTRVIGADVDPPPFTSIHKLPSKNAPFYLLQRL